MAFQFGTSGLIALCGIGSRSPVQQAVAQETEAIELGTILIHGRSGLTWGDTVDAEEIAAGPGHDQVLIPNTPS